MYLQKSLFKNINYNFLKFGNINSTYLKAIYQKNTSYKCINFISFYIRSPNSITLNKAQRINISNS